MRTQTHIYTLTHKQTSQKQLLSTHTHKYINVYTTYTHLHTSRHPKSSSYLHTYINVLMYIHICFQHKQTHIHTLTQTVIPKAAPIYTHTHINVLIYIHICMQHKQNPHTHTYTQTDIPKAAPIKPRRTENTERLRLRTNFTSKTRENHRIRESN